MKAPKRLHQMMCGCGKVVAGGSVFCAHCKAAIERANAKVLGDENIGFHKLVQKRK